MNVVFRVDASNYIGHGHVYRCLTLADALTERRGKIKFICRRLPGNLGGFIEQSGYEVHELPSPEARLVDGTCGFDQEWETLLGVSVERDCWETAAVLRRIGMVDLLVVDHYSLDKGWETPIRNNCRRILVIDDLADRPHDADILVDQTVGRKPEEYRSLVPDNARILTGNAYVMVRPEFRRVRQRSLERRLQKLEANRIQISLGGAGSEQAYLSVLHALKELPRSSTLRVEVVLGFNSTIGNSVREWARPLSFKTEICAGISDMALRMSLADLGIGSAGTTSWERCCVGLPSIIIIMAENQRHIAKELEKEGAAKVIGALEDVMGDPMILAEGINYLRGNPEDLSSMSKRAAALVDGNGVTRVCNAAF